MVNDETLMRQSYVSGVLFAMLNVLIFAVLSTICVADIFTAVADLQNLLGAEKEVTSVISAYIDSELERLQQLKKVANDYAARNAEALSSDASYVSNPVNAYLLIKRLTSDWKFVETMMMQNSAEQFLKNITEWRRNYDEVKYPQEEDLTGAAVALLRLQDTYKLDTHDLASGKIQNNSVGQQLSSHDCFEVIHLDSPILWCSVSILHSILMQELDDVKYPQEEDLTGAAVALLRLQDTYKLDTHDLASGKIQNSSVGQQLSSHDCFEVGRAAYNQNDYYHTILWMQEAQLRLENEDPPTAKIGDVLEYLAFSLYKQGNIKRALALTKKLVQLEPDHPRAKGNVKWYEDMLEDDNKDISELPPLKLERLDDGIPERDVNVTAQSEVYCYLKMDRPFLKLAPIKVEILRFSPLVVLFKQVISDYEIEVIEKLAIPKLKRATVQNARTGDLEYANYRISKSAWLKETDHPAIDRINKRIDLMTNLNQETAEELQAQNYGIGGHYDPHFDFARVRFFFDFQVANYGIGGHYEPHYDMSTVANYGIGGHYEPHYDMSTRGEQEPYSVGMGNRVATVLIYKEDTNAFKTLNTGNRIATILIYMSDVESGGATVFNHLGNAVFPSKYDALFWYNLRRDGEGDLRTRHAACPVLTGIKWVSNKWIHDRGQEFRRPCGLTPNAEERYVMVSVVQFVHSKWN
uniref:procollagen-proline 4-dioxygenase n=1 Tax=Ascaris lumbricoides TaxID=6252 RepID=A0A9J2PY10_ASCLU